MKERRTENGSILHDFNCNLFGSCGNPFGIYRLERIQDKKNHRQGDRSHRTHNVCVAVIPDKVTEVCLDEID